MMRKSHFVNLSIKIHYIEIEKVCLTTKGNKKMCCDKWQFYTFIAKTDM